MVDRRVKRNPRCIFPPAATLRNDPKWAANKRCTCASEVEETYKLLWGVSFVGVEDKETEVITTDSV
jgi:hypothetical protein